MTVIDAPVTVSVAAGRRARSRTRVQRPRAVASLPTVAVRTVVAGLAVSAVWLLLFGFVLSAFQERASQGRLYAELRATLANPPPPAAVAAAGTPVALLAAPGAGIHRVVVVEGTTSTSLRLGPGHRIGSPLPGQPGIAVLFGRAVTYGAPFAHIPRLRPGDVVTATTAQGVFHYRVIDVRRPGDRLPADLATGSNLMLVTSEGSGWRSGWAPDHLVYVDARLTDKPAPAPAPVATATSAAALPLHGDASALYPLILWLQALLVLAVLVTWGVKRWGLWQTWVVGLPAGVAVAWAASNSLFVVLPNVL